MFEDVVNSGGEYYITGKYTNSFTIDTPTYRADTLKRFPHTLHHPSKKKYLPLNRTKPKCCSGLFISNADVTMN